MKYGDFSSLVQLGVGLHAGTALLQIYGDIGVEPIVRTMTRVKELLRNQTSQNIVLADELDQLNSDFDIFRIRLFNEFKRYVVLNSVAAIILTIVLIIISYKAEDIIPDSLTVLFVGLSVLPASITIGVLWFDASTRLKPLKKKADALEQKALRQS